MWPIKMQMPAGPILIHYLLPLILSPARRIPARKIPARRTPARVTPIRSTRRGNFFLVHINSINHILFRTPCNYLTTSYTYYNNCCNHTILITITHTIITTITHTIIAAISHSTIIAITHITITKISNCNRSLWIYENVERWLFPNIHPCGPEYLRKQSLCCRTTRRDDVLFCFPFFFFTSIKIEISPSNPTIEIITSAYIRYLDDHFS